MSDPQVFGSRGSISGPGTGGLLLYCLHQKRAGQAAARDDDIRHSMTAGYAVAAIYTLNEAAMTGQTLTLKGTGGHGTLAAGNRFVLRKQQGVGGPGGITGADVGWIKSASTQAARFLTRGASGDVSADTNSKVALYIDDDATATAAFNEQVITMVACQGHRYDPNSADRPYEADDD